MSKKFFNIDFLWQQLWKLFNFERIPNLTSFISSFVLLKLTKPLAHYRQSIQTNLSWNAFVSILRLFSTGDRFKQLKPLPCRLHRRLTLAPIKYHYSYKFLIKIAFLSSVARSHVRFPLRTNYFRLKTTEKYHLFTYNYLFASMFLCTHLFFLCCSTSPFASVC